MEIFFISDLNGIKLSLSYIHKEFLCLYCFCKDYLEQDFAFQKDLEKIYAVLKSSTNTKLDFKMNLICPNKAILERLMTINN